MRSVRDAFFQVLRDTGMTTVFANPGSTEVPLLAGMPEDLEFVLCLHEASVVGAATGWALGANRAAVALLHTTAGYGNAVGAIATARANRVPLVVIVGQQDRRHLAHEPFLAGDDLQDLAGSYPVFTSTPTRPEDVPGLVARAHHEATIARGPAVVIVPMDDWDAELDPEARWAAPRELHVAAGVDGPLCGMVSDRLRASRSPVIIAGSGADEPRTWDALASLAEALDCPVWQEPFGGRAGFPQDHSAFAGHLPAGRAGVRRELDGHDLVLVVGTSALRQYGFEDGPLFGPGVDVVVVTDQPSEAARTIADLAVLTALPDFCGMLAKLAQQQPRSSTKRARREPPEPAPPTKGPLRAGDVFAALRSRLDASTIVVEESPSSRSELQDTLPAQQSLGFLSAAMGGLGFAMPAAMGLKMATPERPVVAIVGDGSSMYSCQTLWSAQHYGVGVLFVVLSNGGYAIMDRLAADTGKSAPWPSFEDIDISALAASMGCPALRITEPAALLDALDELIPTLPTRTSPLVLDVVVKP
jgi:thiamine pyrophosphate-dependent acetolactate synthase large subunit-like protein